MLLKYRGVMASIQKKVGKFAGVVVFFFVALLLFENIVFAEIYMSVSGTVKDADTADKIAGADVIILQEHILSGAFQSGVTDTQGNFVLGSLPPGEYNLYVFPPDSYVVDTAPRTLTMRSGKNIVGVEIRVEKAGSVSGTAFKDNGTTPLRNASVVAYTSDNNTVFGRTNDAG